MGLLGFTLQAFAEHLQEGQLWTRQTRLHGGGGGQTEIWGFTLRPGGSGEDRASEAKGTSLACSGQREKANKGWGERPPGHAEPRRVGEEFLVHHECTRRCRRIWDGRDVIQFVFKKTTLAAVYERPWVVKGQGRVGDQGRHPGEQDGG